MRLSTVFRPALDGLENRLVLSAAPLSLRAAAVSTLTPLLVRAYGPSRVFPAAEPGAVSTLNFRAANVVIAGIGRFNAVGTITTNASVAPGSVPSRGRSS